MRLATRIPFTAARQRGFRQLRYSSDHSHKSDRSNFIKDLIVHGATKEPITWYSCGPTIYDDAHIGHARTYVCTDIIRRILEDYFQVNIRFAMGITDIDDKIIKKGIEKGYKDWKEYLPMLHQLELDFFNDLDALNVRRPNAVLRVTDHVEDIIKFVEKLEKLGFAYSTPLGVYFNVEKLGSAYGKLCPIPPSNLEEDEEAVTESQQSGSAASCQATSNQGKRHWRDFALWKPHKPGEPSWNSPWGAGRPGWHIECSAMTHAYFGERLHIHSGGVDLKFPHHTNEIAQSEAHHCCPKGVHWVSTWLHTGHLYIEGRKMSKSLKNFVTIRQYLTDGYESTAPAVDFRLFCLLHRYDASVHFSTDQIREAATYRQRLAQFVSLCHAVEMSAAVSTGSKSRARRPTPKSRQLQRDIDLCSAEVRARLIDNFDTPGVLHSLMQLAKDASTYSGLLVASASDGAAVCESHPLEPLLEARDQILKVLELLGVPRGSLGGSDATASASDKRPTGSLSISPERAIDSLTQFRARIRNQCLAELKKLKSLKKENQNRNKTVNNNTSDAIAAENQGAGALSTTILQSYEQHLKSILTLCDQMRDEELLQMGIKVEDLNNNLSSWTLLSTAPLVTNSD